MVARGELSWAFYRPLQLTVLKALLLAILIVCEAKAVGSSPMFLDDGVSFLVFAARFESPWPLGWVTDVRTRSVVTD